MLILNLLCNRGSDKMENSLSVDTVDLSSQSDPCAMNSDLIFSVNSYQLASQILE